MTTSDPGLLRLIPDTTRSTESVTPTPQEFSQWREAIRMAHDTTAPKPDPPVWQSAWREFQDPYLGPDTEKFPSPFESFVAGYLAALRAEQSARQAAEGRVHAAYQHAVDVQNERDALQQRIDAGLAEHRPVPWHEVSDGTSGIACSICDSEQYPCPTVRALTAPTETEATQ